MGRIGGEASCASAVHLLREGLHQIHQRTDHVSAVMAAVQKNVVQACHHQSFLAATFQHVQHVLFYKRAVRLIQQDMTLSRQEEAVRKQTAPTSPTQAASSGPGSPRVHAAFLIREMETLWDKAGLHTLTALQRDAAMVKEQKQWLIETSRDYLESVMQTELQVYWTPLYSTRMPG